MKINIAIAIATLTWLPLAVSPGDIGQRAAAQNPQSTETSADSQAIESAAVAFVERYNQQDAKSLTALFAADAEMVERDGNRFVGPQEIELAFAEVFQQNPQGRISLEVDSIRFVTPNVAVEEGVTIWFPDGVTATNQSTYRAAHVKRDGKWMIAGTRTIDDNLLSSYEYLRDLEWMVGEWINEGKESLVETTVRWSPNRAFLIREFSIKRGGQEMLVGTQRIGWDARHDQFRSWTFDSEGGFVEGLWTRVGTGYVIRSSGYLRDGIAVSGTTRVDQRGDDRLSWSIFNRLRGDEVMPDVDVTIVRKPPQPAAK